MFLEFMFVFWFGLSFLLLRFLLLFLVLLKANLYFLA